MTAPLPTRSIALVLLCLSTHLVADLIEMRDATLIEGKILKIDRSSVVTIQSQKLEKIPFQEIKSFQFADEAGDKKILSSSDLPTLSSLWNERQDRLDLERSAAGEVGLALARANRESASQPGYERALEYYAKIESLDWNRERRELAARGRLQTLIAMGRSEEAIAEAEKTIDTEENPELVLDAHFVIAMARFEKLTALIAEHPRWREDEEVLVEVTAIYHDAVDRFLRPALFHGIQADAAARGLLSAADAHLLVDERQRCEDALTDLKSLYPNQTASEQYKSILARLHEKSHSTLP